MAEQNIGLKSGEAIDVFRKDRHAMPPRKARQALAGRGPSIIQPHSARHFVAGPEARFPSIRKIHLLPKHTAKPRHLDAGDLDDPAMQIPEARDTSEEVRIPVFPIAIVIAGDPVDPDADLDERLDYVRERLLQIMIAEGDERGRPRLLGCSNERLEVAMRIAGEEKRAVRHGRRSFLFPAAGRDDNRHVPPDPQTSRVKSGLKSGFLSSIW